MEEKELNLKEIGERVKQIRIETGIKQQGKKYTWKSFGEILGYNLKKIQNIEYNNNKTIDMPFMCLICETFSVSKDYLLYGKGKMFVEAEKDIVGELKINYNLSTIDVKLIEMFIKLGKEERDVVFEFSKKISAGYYKVINEQEIKQFVFQMIKDFELNKTSLFTFNNSNGEYAPPPEQDYQVAARTTDDSILPTQEISEELREKLLTSQHLAD